MIVAEQNRQDHPRGALVRNDRAEAGRVQQVYVSDVAPAVDMDQGEATCWEDATLDDHDTSSTRV